VQACPKSVERGQATVEKRAACPKSVERGQARGKSAVLVPKVREEDKQQ